MLGYFILMIVVVILSIRGVSYALKDVNKQTNDSNNAAARKFATESHHHSDPQGLHRDDNSFTDNQTTPSDQSNPRTKPLVCKLLWYLSLLCYLVSLAMPFHFISGSYPGGGIVALAIGVIYIPFWIPNPLYFCGLIYAKKNRQKRAAFFTTASTLIAAVPIVVNPMMHPKPFLEHTGPIAYVWFASMLILLLACFIEWAVAGPRIALLSKQYLL